RLQDDAQGASIVDAISALPEQFQFGLSGRDTMPVASIDIEQLRRISSQLAVESAVLWIGWNIPRNVALEHADLLDEQLVDALAALAPIYQLLSWQRNNDPSNLSARLDHMRAELMRAAASRMEQDRKLAEQNARLRQAQTESSRKRTKERVDYDTKRARPTLANLFKPNTDADLSQEPKAFKSSKPTRGSTNKPPDPPAATVTKSRRPRPARHQDAAPPSQGVVSRPRRPKTPAPTYISGGTVTKGARVRVLSGPFEGKIGVIGEFDGRGRARVMLGLLSTQLLVEQLEAVVEAKDRPPLQSSHRRGGLLGRSGK
ncbi:MAG: hypothetical protein CSA75_04260, partial [Sorangium cellulosum]